MNPEDLPEVPPFQTVVLDDPRTSALYVEDNSGTTDPVQVYYNMNHLAYQLRDIHDALAANPIYQVEGPHQAALQGFKEVMVYLLDSADSLASEYSMSKVTDIGDIFAMLGIGLPDQDAE